MGQEHWGTRGGPYGPRADVNVPSQSALSIHCELGLATVGASTQWRLTTATEQGSGFQIHVGALAFPQTRPYPCSLFLNRIDERAHLVLALWPLLSRARQSESTA